MSANVAKMPPRLSNGCAIGEMNAGPTHRLSSYCLAARKSSAWPTPRLFHGYEYKYWLLLSQWTIARSPDCQPATCASVRTFAYVSTWWLSLDCRSVACLRACLLAFLSFEEYYENTQCLRAQADRHSPATAISMAQECKRPHTFMHYLTS